MKVSANAIAVNQAGQVLLILRDDLRVWSIPGGMLDRGESPEMAVVREVQEETGLQVRILRLLGMQFWPLQPTPTLEFNYLCQVEGGKLTPSPESPQVDFFAADDLPQPMLPARRILITNAVKHPPALPGWQTNKLSWWTKAGWFWLTQVVYPLKNLRHRWQGNPYVPPPAWQIEVCLVIRNEGGQALWLKPAEDALWQLPSWGCQDGSVPWEQARRELSLLLGSQLTLTRFIKAELNASGDGLILHFAGRLNQPITLEEKVYFKWDDMPKLLARYRQIRT